MATGSHQRAPPHPGFFRLSPNESLQSSLTRFSLFPHNLFFYREGRQRRSRAVLGALRGIFGAFVYL